LVTAMLATVTMTARHAGPCAGTTSTRPGACSPPAPAHPSRRPVFSTVIVNAPLGPAVTFVGPLFAIWTSACVTIVVMSSALLLVPTGSVVPLGGATVAVLSSVPVALAVTVPVAVKITAVPAGRSTVVAMLPAPFVGQLAPGSATQVQETP